MKTLWLTPVFVLGFAACFPAFATASAERQNPTIEMDSPFFAHKMGVGDPGHVFSPGDDDLECAQAVLFRFAQGPVLGLCKGVLHQDKTGKPYFFVPDERYFAVALHIPQGLNSILFHPDFWMTEFKATVNPNKGLIITEVIREGDVVYSLFQRDILCDAATCTLSAETCAWTIPKNPYPEAVREADRDEKKVPPSVPECEEEGEDGAEGGCPAPDPRITQFHLDVHHLLIQALGGDPSALARLRSISKDLDINLNLGVFEAERLYDRAQGLACLKQ